MNPLARLFAWSDDKRNVDRLVWGLGIVCLLLALADFFYHKHVHYDIENVPGIFGFVGFVVYSVIVMLAKGLRVIIKRPEDYYAPNAVDVENEKGAGTAEEHNA